MGRIFKLLIAVLLPFIAAAIGNLATIPNIPTWYAELDKPPLNPPNGVFGPVWTTLYLLIGLSLYKFWTAEGSEKKWGYIVYGTQLALNALWSIVFFGLQQPLLGVIVIALLDIAVIATVILFYKHSKLAAYLLLPYLLWISFATYLTIGVWTLN